jgi:DNA-binding MurR/RpiR family transcriptional regulator
MSIDGDVLSELRLGYDSLTHSQKRIAEAIVADPEFVAFATVDKLAGRLGVSPSTIVRFAYRIGLEGYQDLQARVRQRVRSQMRGHAAGAGAASVAQHLGETTFAESIQRDVENLNRTVADLTPEVLQSAVDLLQQARRIHVAGYLASDGLATFAALVLSRLHGDTVLLRNDGMLAPAMFEIADQDVVLAFSFPPYAARSLQVVETGRARGARVIAVTDSFISPVAQQADVVLTTHVSGVSTQNSLVAPLVVVNAVLNAFAASTPEATRRYEQIMRSMGTWEYFVLRDEQEA